MMETFIMKLLEDFSYFTMVLLLTFEFIPGEFILPFAGYLVYEGEMTLFGATLAGAIGGTTGPLTFYALGKYAGRPFILKYGKYMFIKQKHMDKADAFFDKHGGIVAFTGRFLPGIRTLISIPCGLAKMNIWLFTIYTFIAMIPISYFYIYLGMQLGPHWQEVESMTNHPVFYFILAAIAIVIFLSIAFRKKGEETITIPQLFHRK